MTKSYFHISYICPKCGLKFEYGQMSIMHDKNLNNIVRNTTLSCLSGHKFMFSEYVTKDGIVSDDEMMEV